MPNKDHQNREIISGSTAGLQMHSGQSVTASDFGSNGPRFEAGRGRCVESSDKALYSHCPKEKPCEQHENDINMNSWIQ